MKVIDYSYMFRHEPGCFIQDVIFFQTLGLQNKHVAHLNFEPFLYRQILDSFKELADDKFEFAENGRKWSKRMENTMGKGEIAHYEQFLLFPSEFSKDSYCRHRKRRVCFGKGLVKTITLHRLRNKFLQLTLISLDSASWELHQYSHRICGPMKNPTPGTRTWDVIIAKG